MRKGVDTEYFCHQVGTHGTDTSKVLISAEELTQKGLVVDIHFHPASELGDYKCMQFECLLPYVTKKEISSDS